jgi:hypothetical protein
MPLHPLTRHELPQSSRAFYNQVNVILKDAKIPFLVGGAFALEYYTGVWRYTKDLDIFVRPQDSQKVLEAAAAAGFRSELTFSHWLGKIFARPRSQAQLGNEGGDKDDFIDVIFSSGNGVVKVDDSWFTHAATGQIAGFDVEICPVEEMIWSKAFIMERERFDGADIAHLIHAKGEILDWSRLLGRFGPHWEILLSHLVLFGFIYPGRRAQIPEWLLQELVQKLLATRQNASAQGGPPFQGTLLSREQYIFDLASWGYSDPRLLPAGSMTADEIAVWTAAIERGPE